MKRFICHEQSCLDAMAIANIANPLELKYNLRFEINFNLSKLYKSTQRTQPEYIRCNIELEFHSVAVAVAVAPYDLIGTYC